MDQATNIKSDPASNDNEDKDGFNQEEGQKLQIAQSDVVKYVNYLVAGNLRRCKQSTELIVKIARVWPREYFNLIDTIERLIDKDGAIYSIAAVLVSEDVPNEIKEKVKPYVSKMCTSDEQFFDFIKYFTELRQSKTKITKLLKKLIIQYYNSKDAHQLARSVAIVGKRHGWTHKKLIKLSHLKTTDPLKSKLVKYILYGPKGVERKTGDEFSKLIANIEKRQILRKTKDMNKAVKLIGELHATHKDVNNALLKQDMIWSAILFNLSVYEILSLLTKFHQLSLLKPETKTYQQCQQLLTNTDLIRKCSLHPIDVAINLKDFQKGGRPLKPKLLEYLTSKHVKDEPHPKVIARNEPKCPELVTTIQKCMSLSYNNMTTIQKTIMITIDISNETRCCINNKNLLTLEAAFILTNYYLRLEQQVYVAVFVNHRVKKIDLTRDESFTQFLQKIQTLESQYMMPSTSLHWAFKKKKKVDLFINVMSCQYLSKIPDAIQEKYSKLRVSQPLGSLIKYKKMMRCPNTKLVRAFFDGVCDDKYTNSMDLLSVVGFSSKIFHVIQDFCLDKIDHRLLETRINHYIFA